MKFLTATYGKPLIAALTLTPFLFLLNAATMSSSAFAQTSSLKNYGNSAGQYYSNNGSESYPAPQTSRTQSSGDAPLIVKVQDGSGSDRGVDQPKQLLKVKTADCKNGIDQKTGESVLVCELGHNG